MIINPLSTSSFSNPVFLFADLELQYVLDAKKEQRKRMFFMSEEGQSRRKKTITMLKGREFKESFTVYLSPAGVKDKLTSLDVQVSHRYKHSKLLQSPPDTL